MTPQYFFIIPLAQYSVQLLPLYVFFEKNKDIFEQNDVVFPCSDASLISLQTQVIELFAKNKTGHRETTGIPLIIKSYFSHLEKIAERGKNLSIILPLTAVKFSNGFDFIGFIECFKHYKHLSRFVPKIIWPTCRSDYEAEATAETYRDTEGIRKLWLLEDNPLAGDLLLEAAHIVGRENFTLLPLPESLLPPLEPFLQALGLPGCDTLGIMEKFVPFPSPLWKPLWDMLYLNYWPLNPGVVQGIDCWRRFFMLSLRDLPPFEHTVLSPDDLRAIRERHAPSYARASRLLLGCEDMFAGLPPREWEQQENWRPTSFEVPYKYWKILGEALAETDRETMEQSYAKLRSTVYFMPEEMKIVAKACADKWGKPWPPGPSGAKLSVLTLTYNHERFIAQHIESVLAQETDFPVDHIIVDNHSTDKTREIIESYAERHASIKPYFMDALNPRNDAVHVLFSLCRTEYAALCDGDDYFINPLKLQKQVDFLEENKRCSICFHPVQVKWENKEREDLLFPDDSDLPPHKPPYNLADLLRGNFMSTSSVVYRWRFRDGLPDWFDKEVLPGDWYWHMLHAEMGRIGFIDEVMSVYRRHSEGLWAKADTDYIEHKKKYGILELRTYIVMDDHLGGRYREILKDNIFREFSALIELSDNYNTPEPFEQAVQLFPEWVQRVSEMVDEKQRGQAGEGKSN